MIGSTKTRDAEQGLLLDELERSRYVKVINSNEDWLSLRSDQSVVVHMVDWVALERDCHFLQQMYSGLPQSPTHQLVYS